MNNFKTFTKAIQEIITSANTANIELTDAVASVCERTIVNAGLLTGDTLEDYSKAFASITNTAERNRAGNFLAGYGLLNLSWNGQGFTLVNEKKPVTVSPSYEAAPMAYNAWKAPAKARTLDVLDALRKVRGDLQNAKVHNVKPGTKTKLAQVHASEADARICALINELEAVFAIAPKKLEKAFADANVTSIVDAAAQRKAS